MAVGDVTKNLQSIAAGAYLDIQPSGTAEWVIHNIYHEYDVQLEVYDGTNSLIFDIDSGTGVYAKYAFHCTNAQRIRVKNTHTSVAKLIGYDGIVTHT
ncbi:MAG: hypothetical protein NWE98_00365 [Candidatus Bathyarchaeota archaeon]|nr:hypothetical protein [Candidatus Bathyarchaeota archaeon]